MIRFTRKQLGVTLLEILLVMVVISTAILMLIGYMQQRTLQTQIDRSAAQMQQILSASLAYYVDNGKWPVSVACLQANDTSGDCGVAYLPQVTISNPFATSNYILTDETTRVTVSAAIQRGAPNSRSIAVIIAGKLPLGFDSTVAAGTARCSNSSTTCYVNASVTIPSELASNIGNVNFAGLYKHGGCVPVPTCPLDSTGLAMEAQVFIVPVSVSGVNDPNDPSVYPISSFTAYATGGDNANPAVCNAYDPDPPSCGSTVGTPASNKYWRACLQVITEKGEVAATNTGGTDSAVFPYYPWGGNVTLMAITRCQPTNEASGSDFTVFSQ